MVLIWNDLACGDREAAALLVAINSVFQVLAYALLGTFYLQILPGWLGLPTQDVTFSTWDITESVLIFLGIPLAAGYAARRILRPRRGADWYDWRHSSHAAAGVSPEVHPGRRVIQLPCDVARVHPRRLHQRIVPPGRPIPGGWPHGLDHT